MYRYPKSKEEIAAEQLLRSKGWSVSEPKCPLCHGWGMISKSDWKKIGEYPWGETMGSGGWWTERCPNGCPAPTAYFYNTLDHVSLNK